MANLPLQLPSVPPFSPHGEPNLIAQKWTKWKSSFGYFLTATGVRDDNRRKAMLLHLVGQDTQEVFDTLGVADGATYDQTLAALDEKFDVPRNVSYERSVFHNARQKEKESIEQYVTRLRTLSRYCEYGNLIDEHIRDQVVATCTAGKLRKQLLSTPNLTLDRLRELGRTYENSTLLSTKLENADVQVK